jgi:hypothetical protein
MTPEERQLLAGLFDRIRSTANTPRDLQAEAFIAENVKAVPSAPYYLAQAVLVQEQALAAANQRLQELEAKVQTSDSPGFLSGLGKFLSGGSTHAAPPPSAPPPSAPPPPRSSTYAAPPAGPWAPASQGGPGGPWGGQGGGFLSGALTTAAGVAGGMLLADSVRNLFTGGHNLGLSNIAGAGMSGGSPVPDETIINNYYSQPDPAGQHAQDVLQDMDQDQDMEQDASDFQDAADDSNSDFGSGDDSFNV